MAILHVAFALAAIASGEGAQITLTCTGQQTMTRNDIQISSTIPWSETFTIDVAHHTFCGTTCAKHTIVDLTDPTKIVLNEFRRGKGSTPLTFDTASKEISGLTVESLDQKIDMTLTKSGKCSVSSS